MEVMPRTHGLSRTCMHIHTSAHAHTHTHTHSHTCYRTTEHGGTSLLAGWRCRGKESARARVLRTVSFTQSLSRIHTLSHTLSLLLTHSLTHTLSLKHTFSHTRTERVGKFLTLQTGMNDWIGVHFYLFDKTGRYGFHFNVSDLTEPELCLTQDSARVRVGAGGRGLELRERGRGRGGGRERENRGTSRWGSTVITQHVPTTKMTSTLLTHVYMP